MPAVRTLREALPDLSADAGRVVSLVLNNFSEGGTPYATAENVGGFGAAYVVRCLRRALAGPGPNPEDVATAADVLRRLEA